MTAEEPVDVGLSRTSPQEEMGGESLGHEN